MFICLDSKYSLKHMGHFHCFFCCTLQIKLCTHPVLDTISGGLPFSSFITNIRGAGVLKGERDFFLICLLLTVVKVKFCSNYITLSISSLKETVKVENSDRTNVHHIIDVLLKAMQILQWQLTK